MKSNLICPHCGGPFQIDDQMSLQPDWHCPYCSQVSHFKIKQGQLSLESVLHAGNETADNNTSHLRSAAFTEDSDAATVKADAKADDDPVDNADSSTDPISNAVTAGTAAADEVAADAVSGADATMADTSTAGAAAATAGAAALGSVAGADAQLAINENLYQPAAVADEIESNNTAENASHPLASEIKTEVLTSGKKSHQPLKSDMKATESETSKHTDKLADEAFAAYKSLNMPLFNVLARQLLDINPQDKRVYAWRAVLREYTDGFARCWADPVWPERAKSQQQVILRQHFYDLTMAFRLESEDEQIALAEEVSQLIADQIVRIFSEAATMRRTRRFRRAFKGKYAKKDLLYGHALNLTWQVWPAAVPEAEEAGLPDACKQAVQQKDYALYQALTKYKYF